MTIYEELVVRVDKGETFHIDFEKRTMKVGKHFLIKNGEYESGRQLFTRTEDMETHCPMELILGIIDMLYKNYKYSLPSERSESKRKGYFKALPFDKLSDEHLFVAGKREVKRAQLEGFILCMILEGKFAWDEKEMGKWFYQAKQDSDLIILKKWII